MRIQHPALLRRIKNKLVKCLIICDDSKMLECGITYPILPKIGCTGNFELFAIQFKPDWFCFSTRLKYHG